MVTDGASHPDRGPSVYPAWIAGIIAAGLYFLTSAPTITWVRDSQDSGELAACATILGITHPTGYPLYMLLGWLFIHLLPGGEPGRAMVILSVVSGGVAVGITARAAALAIRLIWKEGRMGRDWAGWWGAFAAGFALTSPLIWSQSVVCEVYSFAVLLQSLAWLFLVKYLVACDDGSETGGAYKRVLALVGEGSERRAAGAVIALGGVLGLILAHHVAGAAIILPIAIALARCRFPLSPRLAGKALAAMLPGLALYLYLPIRSMANPPLDWGNPETFRGFVNHVMAVQYRELAFGTSWTEFTRRLDAFRWEDYWGLLALVLFFVGLLAYLPTPKRSPGRALAVAIPPYIIWTLLFASGYRVTDYEVFYYPLAVPVSILIAPGLAAFDTMLRRVNRLLPWLLVAFVAAMLVTAAVNRRVDMNCNAPACNSAATFAFRELSVLPENSLVVASTDGHLFSLMYAVTCGVTNPITAQRLPPRDDIDLVASNWVRRDWFRENVRNRYGPDGRLKFTSESPDLSIALRALVDENVPYRPVYVDGRVLQLIRTEGHSYQASSTVALFRIIPPD